MCPWREPESDLREFFPTATGYEVETRILSGLRPELAQVLGRPPSAEENALLLYRVHAGPTLLGMILTRRTKGTYGAIEMVLALDKEQKVRGLRLQRLREPEPVAQALQSPSWTSWFVGKDASSSWEPGAALENIPQEGRTSAGAVVEAARSLVLLAKVAECAPSPMVQAAHSHH